MLAALIIVITIVIITTIKSEEIWGAGTGDRPPGLMGTHGPKPQGIPGR